LRTYLRAFGHYLALLAYLPWDALNVSSALLILILLGAIAALARSRCSKPRILFLNDPFP
jgi:hypothetical protein